MAETNNNYQRKVGVLLSYLSQAIHMLSSIIYTPIMLRLLGQSEYGIYQLVYSTVSYLGLLSFGFSSAYMRFYSRFRAQKKDIEISKLNGMFLTIFTILAVICLCCGFIMLGNIELIFGDKLNALEYNTARKLMILMVINLSLTFPDSVFNSIISSKEKFIFQKILLVLQNLLNPFITLPLLIMGYGSVAMVVVTTALTFGKFFSHVFYCLKKLKISFSFSNFDIYLLKEMWGFTFFIFINMIVDQINWSVDKLLLGRISGTIAVAIYGVSAQLNSIYLQLSSSISGVFIPKVNKIVAESNDDHLLTDLFTKIGRIQFMLLSLVLTGFIIFGKPFIYIWAGEGYESSYFIALLLMIPVTIPLIQNLGIDIQRAKNMHKARSVVYLFIAICNIFLSIPLIKLYGGIGAAIGTAISLFVGNGIFINWYYHYRVGLNIKYFWTNIIKITPAIVIPCLFGILLNIVFYINTIIKLFVFIGLYSVIYCISIYFLALNNDEKSLVNSVINKFINKCV